jgi:hypothetical protein
MANDSAMMEGLISWLRKEQTQHESLHDHDQAKASFFDYMRVCTTGEDPTAAYAIARPPGSGRSTQCLIDLSHKSGSPAVVVFHNLRCLPAANRRRSGRELCHIQIFGQA